MQLAVISFLLISIMTAMKDNISLGNLNGFNLSGGNSVLDQFRKQKIIEEKQKEKDAFNEYFKKLQFYSDKREKQQKQLEEDAAEQKAQEQHKKDVKHLSELDHGIEKVDSQASKNDKIILRGSALEEKLRQYMMLHRSVLPTQVQLKQDWHDIRVDNNSRKQTKLALIDKRMRLIREKQSFGPEVHAAVAQKKEELQKDVEHTNKSLFDVGNMFE